MLVVSGNDLDTVCCQWNCHGPEKLMKDLGSQISVKWERGLGGGCVWTTFKPKKHKKYILRYKKTKKLLIQPYKMVHNTPH